MKLSKSIIKKYGISKKAWVMQRKQGGYRKAKASPVTYKRRGKRTMTKKKSYRKAKGLFGNLNTPLMGAAGVVAYESLISPMIPLQGVAKDMLELVGGLYLSKKKGFLGATGKSLVVINAYQLISGIAGPALKGFVGGRTDSGNYDYLSN